MNSKIRCAALWLSLSIAGVVAVVGIDHLDRVRAQSTGQTTFGLQFAQAYYAAQNPIKAPFYNGRPGGNAAVQLTTAQENALVTQVLAAGVTMDEQIDYWGWDPLTVMQMRLLQGIMWVPSGLGPATCSSILQSGCVITPGMYSGSAPAGSIVTSVSLSSFPPWPSDAPPTPIPAAVVGAAIAGPYYEVIGTVPAIGTKTTTPALSCVLTQIPNQELIGDGTMMNVWQCSSK